MVHYPYLSKGIYMVDFPRKIPCKNNILYLLNQTHLLRSLNHLSEPTNRLLATSLHWPSHNSIKSVIFAQFKSTHIFTKPQANHYLFLLALPGFFSSQCFLFSKFFLCSKCDPSESACCNSSNVASASSRSISSSSFSYSKIKK